MARILPDSDREQAERQNRTGWPRTCRSRFPVSGIVGCRTMSGFFFFPLLSSDSHYPRQDYLIFALIAERTKRKWPYPATIVVMVHDLRAAVVIFCRSRILTCWSREREISSIPRDRGYHLAEIVPCPTCHVGVASWWQI